MTDVDVLAGFGRCPVLVVGDLMLDKFLWGRVSRTSPEAPVPVVEVRRRTVVAGGAGNAAANVADLGGLPALAGVVGSDADGTRLRDLLAARGVDVRSVVRDPTGPTTTKTRIVAHGQHVVRLDRERPGRFAAGVSRELASRVCQTLPSVRGCVISDYGKGVVTPGLCRRTILRARSAGVPVVVDPKGADYAKYRGATLVKPNELEAGRAVNRVLRSEADVTRAGGLLVDLLGPGTAVLITRGPRGMALFEAGREPVRVPAEARDVYDVTGAGDAVAGALALALAAGADLPAACRLASLAAAVVIGKVGTATCSFDELCRAGGARLPGGAGAGTPPSASGP